jgi:uncharacterized membrane protein
MNSKLVKYVEELFNDAPKTKKVNELKEEILANLYDKYNDLIQSGRDENEAYNMAISSIGDVDELIQSLNDNDVMDQDKSREDQKRSALFIAISVMLYIMSPVPIILSGGVPVFEDIGLMMMFMFIAVATGLLVYNANSRPKYHKANETIVEEFKEWKSHNKQIEKVKNSIISAAWAIIVALYFILSFTFGIWAYSWIIFIIGVAIDKIIRAYFELKE